jgi:hypothetical protein
MCDQYAITAYINVSSHDRVFTTTLLYHTVSLVHVCFTCYTFCVQCKLAIPRIFTDKGALTHLNPCDNKKVPIAGSSPRETDGVFYDTDANVLVLMEAKNGPMELSGYVSVHRSLARARSQESPCSTSAV